MTLFLKSGGFAPPGRRFHLARPGDHPENAKSDKRRGSRPIIGVDLHDMNNRSRSRNTKKKETKAKYAEFPTQNDPQLARSPVIGTESDAIARNLKRGISDMLLREIVERGLVSILPRTTVVFLSFMLDRRLTAGCSQDKFPRPTVPDPSLILLKLTSRRLAVAFSTFFLRDSIV